MSDRLAQVEMQADPNRPGRTAYRITGHSAAAVQDAIDTLSRQVDVAFGGVPGSAAFVGPARSGAGWQAFGEIVVLSLELVP